MDGWMKLSTGQRAVMVCSWGVRAGVAHSECECACW